MMKLQSPDSSEEWFAPQLASRHYPIPLAPWKCPFQILLNASLEQGLLILILLEKLPGAKDMILGCRVARWSSVPYPQGGSLKVHNPGSCGSHTCRNRATAGGKKKMWVLHHHHHHHHPQVFARRISSLLCLLAFTSSSDANYTTRSFRCCCPII